jgi:diaminopropionate ammonia-lyase
VTRVVLRTPTVQPDPPDRAPLEWHRRLPGYERTPLLDCRSVAEELGLRRVWVKDESSRLGLPSFKILGASWGVFSALDERVGGFGPWSAVDDLRGQLESHRPLALAAATDGNHGRAVARMARLLGLEARIFVPAGTAAARIEGIESEGASCQVVDGTYDDAVARSAEEASDDCLVISDTSWSGYEDVPRWVIEGYSTIFHEIADELNEGGHPEPDVVVIQVGVGALGAAAVRHWRSVDSATPKMVCVEPERAACVLASVEAGQITHVPGPHDSIMAGLNCGTPSLVAWPLVSTGFDTYVAIEDNYARVAMKTLAGAGIVAGETGAAGLGGLVALAERVEGEELGFGDDMSVLLLSTEGATDPAAYDAIVTGAGTHTTPPREEERGPAR